MNKDSAVHLVNIKMVFYFTINYTKVRYTHTVLSAHLNCTVRIDKQLVML